MICSIYVLESIGEGECCYACTDPGNGGCAPGLICVDSSLSKDCSGICVGNGGNFKSLVMDLQNKEFKLNIPI